MTDLQRNKCRTIYNNLCPRCKHQKKCSIKNAILIPMFVWNEKPMFAPSVADKIFIGNTCKSFKE